MQAWEISVIWSRVVFVFNSCLAQALFSFTSVSLVMLGSTVWQIRGAQIGGVMSSAAVAVLLGAAEIVWLDQRQKHRRLGFLFGWRPVRSCISWKRYVDDVVVGSRVFCCSCIFVFLRPCYLVPISLLSGADTAVHTWVDVELRVIGQQVAVNIKNPNRSRVHNRGPQQKSTFLPWTGVDWVSFGVLYCVIWPEPRCWARDSGWRDRRDSARKSSSSSSSSSSEPRRKRRGTQQIVKESAEIVGKV